MGGDSNTIKLLSGAGVEEWPNLAKDQVAQRLVEKITTFFDTETISV